MWLKSIIPIFLFLFIFSLVKISYAFDTYFDFYLPSRFLSQDSEYQVNISYLLQNVNEKSFIVIPSASNSLVEIFNEDSNSWVKQNSLRAEFPKLKPVMKIKINSFNSVRTRICFEIQFIKTAEIFKTPCRTFWNKEYFQKYLSAVNDRIFKWVTDRK